MFSFLIGLGDIGQGAGFGAYNVVSGFDNAVKLFNQVVSNVIGFITIVAGLYFLVQFIVGAFSWLTSSGEKDKIKGAQDRITHAVIGLTLVIAAYALISILGSLLGLTILNPYAGLSQINPKP